MTRAAEVFWIPLVFLTVTLLGGVRIADRVVFLRPPLSALVLAVLLLAALVRCGAFAPQRLMNPRRPALANLSGVTVLATMFAASVQAFNSVIPESGLPRLVVVVFLFVLLLNTLAASTDRTHVLRSTAVILGSMFVLKYIILAALSDPTGGWLTRVLIAALEGVTLGTLAQQPFGPATGYVAFLTLALFLGGLAVLPRRETCGEGALVSAAPGALRDVG
ncbi:MAG TPA: hypothetical protein VKE51_19095 [Vicinamibacterales bacterium]|nr:hypothetical protein [Vicinamibacterales bacterium]